MLLGVLDSAKPTGDPCLAVRSAGVSQQMRVLEIVFERRSKMEEFCRGAANIEIIGRGPAHGAAIMGALCIREMTGQRAAAHSGGGFRHGPCSM